MRVTIENTIVNPVHVNALVAGLLCLASAAVQGVAGQPEGTQTAEVLRDSTLTLLSFAGSIGGGFMALAFFPTKHDKGTPTRNQLRADAMRWLSCSIFGGVFSPFVVEYILTKRGFPVSASVALATSAFLGLFAWLFVRGFHNYLVHRFDTKKTRHDV
tara:strand:- start:2674 stop:3147 length:474 start_codon:yes stop_codon:yes gene_type:complete